MNTQALLIMREERMQASKRAPKISFPKSTEMRDKSFPGGGTVSEETYSLAQSTSLTQSTLGGSISLAEESGWTIADVDAQQIQRQPIVLESSKTTKNEDYWGLW